MGKGERESEEGEKAGYGRSECAGKRGKIGLAGRRWRIATIS
jgi:hypothetical protein